MVHLHDLQPFSSKVYLLKVKVLQIKKLRSHTCDVTWHHLYMNMKIKTLPWTVNVTGSEWADGIWTCLFITVKKQVILTVELWPPDQILIWDAVSESWHDELCFVLLSLSFMIKTHISIFRSSVFSQLSSTVSVSRITEADTVSLARGRSNGENGWLIWMVQMLVDILM